MIILTKETIGKFFSMQDSMEAVKKAFSLFSKGKIDVPLRTQMVTDDQQGVYTIMPAYSKYANAACVKVLSTFNRNIEKGLPSLNAQILVMSDSTGVIEAVIDGAYVTSLRTGAASGVAIDILAKQSCSKGALIGTGGQGAAQLEAMLTARRLDEVHLYDADAERAGDFLKAMRARLEKFNTKLVLAADPDNAIIDADVVITATPSAKPVFDGSKVKQGATISGIGSYRPDMQELDPELLVRASKIFYDSKEAILSEPGDILIPLNDGTMAKDKLTGELGDVINGEIPGRQSDLDIIVFKTVGIAAQDLITSKHIFDKAVQGGFGITL